MLIIRNLNLIGLQSWAYLQDVGEPILKLKSDHLFENWRDGKENKSRIFNVVAIWYSILFYSIVVIKFDINKNSYKCKQFDIYTRSHFETRSKQKTDK